jgi:hypothetical protein
MEELSNSQYIKSTDSVEKYLLNIIQQYFRANNVASEDSREYIIKKAVKRMKDELDFDSLGVLSIIMPDGEVRTGNVSISLEELGGEPLILPKRTAFNVDFGSEAGTACEGNDPRLSDKRLPLSHKHKIDDIKNLANELSSINGKIDRVVSHEHNNKDILDRITYSGTRASFDLADVDKVESNIKQMIQQNTSDITDYHNIIDAKVTQVNADIDDLNQQINDLRQFVITRNDAVRQEVMEYVDNMIAAVSGNIQEITGDFVTKNMLNEIVAIANYSYIYLGTTQIQVDTAINDSVNNMYEIQDASIANAINAIHPVLSDNDVITQVSLTVTNDCTYNLPYLVISNNEFKGTITASCDKSKVIIHFDATDIPVNVRDGFIKVNYYTKQKVTL